MNVSGVQPTVSCGYKESELSREDAQDKEDWKLRIVASPGLPRKWLLKWCVLFRSGVMVYFIKSLCCDCGFSEIS